MDLQRTTARLRRTFAYRDDPSHPSDSDSDSPQALDEQEQEDLIRLLAQQNESRNAQFRLFLLLVPLLSAVPYLLLLSPLSSTTSTSTSILLALLSLTSLGCTSWMLWALPPGVTGVRALDAWVAGRNNTNKDGASGSGSGSRGVAQARSTNTMGVGPMAALSASSSSSSSSSPWGGIGRRKGNASSRSADVPFWAPGQQRSPLEQYLPYLNAALCAMLALAGAISGGGRDVAAGTYWGHVSLANLPAFVYAVVLVAKMVMGGVDPERELAGLRYDYKGA